MSTVSLFASGLVDKKNHEPRVGNLGMSGDGLSSEVGYQCYTSYSVPRAVEIPISREAK